MGAYFLRRLLLLIPTFIGITFLVFSVTRFVPGGPVEQMLMQTQAAASEGGAGGGGLTQDGGLDVPQELKDALEKQYNLDKPFVVAYLYWVSDVVRLDLGTSYKYNMPVWELIKSRFPVSIYFGLIGFILAYSVCIPLGIMKAVKHGSLFDFSTSALVFVGYSVPGWAIGALLLVIFGGGSGLDWFPLGGFRSPGWEEMTLWNKVTDQLHHTVLPIIAYAIGSFASLTVLMKNSLMENLGQDYVRTAFAKGLPEYRVIGIHAVRNSLIPICTGLGHAIGLVMAGSYLVELMFNIDGIGFLGYTSIVERDYAVVLGILVINTTLVLFGNILSDVLYVIVDPRIRFS